MNFESKHEFKISKLFYSPLIQNSKFKIFVLILVTLSFAPLQIQALSFNPEHIISDDEFFNAKDMSREEVQSFLERKKSTLATYLIDAADGSRTRASDIIWESATNNGLNPKVLLVLLQKEQSLIENPRPTQYSYDWATGYARCDACPASDPAIAAYKGFTTQVEKAAWRTQYYVSNPYKFNYRKGVQAIIDGFALIPQNDATASLYNYTPHLRGNFSFWKLWQRYFGKAFPDGMLVKETDRPSIWLIQDGKKRLITSMSVLRSHYSEQSLVSVSPGSLETYPEGAAVRFMRYSLAQIPSGGIFLIADEGKYIIPSREVFRAIGFNPDEVIRVNDHDLSDVPTLGMLSKERSPIEELVQDTRTGGVFALSGGIKRPLLERPLLQTNFYRTPIRPEQDGELDRALIGQPVLFRDGTLVKTEDSATVYIISRGEKRPFVSEEAFTSLGFSWNQIVLTAGYTLALHPVGAPVDIGRVIDDEYPEQPTALATVPPSTLYAKR